jgi:hypothetical protein
MRLKRIEIRNWGPLKKAVWDIDPAASLAVLCGQHGTGKSSFLNAAAYCLESLFYDCPSSKFAVIYHDYYHQIQLHPTDDIDTQLLERKTVFAFPSFESLSFKVKELYASRIPFALVQPDKFSGFQTYTSHSLFGLRAPDRLAIRPFSSPADPLELTANVLKYLKEDERITLLQNINAVLEGAVGLVLEYDNRELFCRRSKYKNKLNAPHLSEGENYAIGLLLIGLGVIPETGILLLDAPEAHLHPAAQTAILTALKIRLRFGQILIATHSPSLIASCAAGRVYLLKRSSRQQVPISVNSDLAVSFVRDLYGAEVREALIAALSESTSTTVLSYLLECSLAPDIALRRKGDPQIKQLATWLFGSLHSEKHRLVRIVDVGAGNGDFLEAINASGCADRIVYIPIEPNKSRWQMIAERCRQSVDLKFEEPLSGVDGVLQADIICFVNVLHELDLATRAQLLAWALAATSPNGTALIHEVVGLPVGEINFLMWDSQDIRSIMSAVMAPIEICTASTISRPGGWPLETICLRCSAQPPEGTEIYEATIRDLHGLLTRWTERLSSEIPTEMREDLKPRFRAFLMAQVANASLWLHKEKNRRVCDT